VGGTVHVTLPLSPEETTLAAQSAGQPVPFSITVELPDGVTAEDASCEVDGASCEATVTDDGATIALAGEIEPTDTTPQPRVSVTFDVVEDEVAGYRNLTACTAVGAPGSSTPTATDASGACEGTELNFTFQVASGDEPDATPDATTLPSTGHGPAQEDATSPLLVVSILALVATMAALAVMRLRRV